MKDFEKRPVTAQDVRILLDKVKYSYNGLCSLCRCSPADHEKGSSCPTVSIRERIEQFGLAPAQPPIGHAPNYDPLVIEDLSRGIYPQRCMGVHDREDPSGYSAVCCKDQGETCHTGQGSATCVLWDNVNFFSDEKLAEDLVAVRAQLATERQKQQTQEDWKKKAEGLKALVQELSNKLHCYSQDNHHSEVTKLLSTIDQLKEENSVVTEHLGSSERHQRDALGRAIQAETECDRLREVNAENKRRAATGRIRGARDFVYFLTNICEAGPITEETLQKALVEYSGGNKEGQGKICGFSPTDLVEPDPGQVALIEELVAGVEVEDHTGGQEADVEHFLKGLQHIRADRLGSYSFRNWTLLSILTPEEIESSHYKSAKEQGAENMRTKARQVVKTESETSAPCWCKGDDEGVEREVCDACKLLATIDEKLQAMPV